MPKIISFRYNPGKSAFGGNFIIGRPEESKFGLTKKQLFKAYKKSRQKGIKRFGLHAMIASNELRPRSFIEVTKMLFDLAEEISWKLGIDFEFINLGGGLGIPYRPEEKPINLKTVAIGIKKLYEQKIAGNKLKPFKIFMECGRFITGPHGYLIAKILHLKKTYKNYIGLDACMANLMRPGMYGAYHHITLLGKKTSGGQKYDVVGSLCENNDKFAIDRHLLKPENGDILIIHDAGAHGHAMGFNYNGKLRSAEILLKKNGKFNLIRRAETLDDYFATLLF